MCAIGPLAARFLKPFRRKGAEGSCLKVRLEGWPLLDGLEGSDDVFRRLLGDSEFDLGLDFRGGSTLE